MKPIRPGEPYGAAHLIERQMLLSSVRQKGVQDSPTAEPARGIRFLTISRYVGSLGDPIASALASHLGWHVYDREIVDHIARNSHVRQSLVQELDERSQSLVHDTVQRFLEMIQGGSFGVEDYHGSLYKTLVFLGTRGKAILVGRGANFVLRGHPGLHVGILASPEVRVQRLCQIWNTTPDEARRRMRQCDSERRNFVHHHFKRDPDDPCSYDLVFNTDRLSLEQVVDSIKGAMIHQAS